MYSYELARSETVPWAITPETLAELEYRLQVLKPKNILECGSGISTLILARYAERFNAKITSFEHNETYYQRTKEKLKNTANFVDLRLTNLIGKPPVYNTDLPKNIDFVLIDGPPEGSGGRASIFPWILPNLAKDWEIWVDDGDRKIESESIWEWKKLFKMNVTKTELRKGLTILSSKPLLKGKNVTKDLIVTLLSGNRPHLLNETLKCLPSFLFKKMIGIVNGGDLATIEVFNSYKIRYEIINMLLPIGEATSFASEIALQSGANYWLHFEDDWKFITLDTDWLKRAKKATEDNLQVRLRHFSEKVLPYHMITQKPINWESAEYGTKGNAHLTFNPFLMKCENIPLVFPCTGEKDAQRNAMNSGIETVGQLYPGICIHIGDNDSLRKKTGCEL